MLPLLPSTSMEIVATSDFTVICTLVFYDSFDGDPETFVALLRQAAMECEAPIVADAITSHKSLFDAASSLWGMIDGMKRNPLVWMIIASERKESPATRCLTFSSIGGSEALKAPRSAP